MIDLQTLRHQWPPRQPLLPTRLHFRFFPYRTLQVRSADAYISTSRTGRPYRPTSGSSLSYGTATFYPLIPRRRSPRIHLVYPTLLLTRTSRTSHHIQLLLDKRAIEEIPRSTPGFYSRIFLAPKKSGDWRPVIDLSALNMFLRSPHFRMETPTSIMRSLQPGHWATSLDFKDAFFHVPVAPAHRRYLSFRFGHRYFRFQSLPFGLAMSPYLFTRLVKAVGTFARSQGLSLLLYLDDWNISAPSAPACMAWTSWLLTLSERLGLVVNMDKCELVPSRRFVFVGIDFDLANGTARPAAPPSVEPSALSTDLHIAQGPPGHQVAAISWPYDFPGETHSTGLSPHASPSVRSQGQLGPVVGPPLYTGTHSTGRPLSTAVVEFPPQLTTTGPPIPPLPQLQLFTDASIEGLGGGSPDVSPDFRHMVPSAEVPAHQQSGTAGGSPRTSALPPPGHQQGRDSDDGQHHSRQPDQEPGWHTLTISVPPDCTPPRVGGQQTHHPGPTPHPRTSERGGRLIVPATSDHRLGVDTVSADTPPRVAPMGPASCRPLCHFGNHLPAHVRLSTPRPASVEDRCIVLSVDGSVGLHVSSLPSNSGGAPEDTGVQLPRHPSGPSMAVSTLVSPSTVTARQPPETPTSAADATAPTSVPNLSPGPVTPLSACLEAIKSALVSRGYSSTVATHIAASHCLSTQSVYDSK